MSYREQFAGRDAFEKPQQEIDTVKVAVTGTLSDGEDFASQDRDIDALLDAVAMLITLPRRLVEIGYDRLNGKKLSVADQRYWIRHKEKLDCRRGGRQLSDWEKKRIERLHGEGMSVYKIAKAMCRSTTTVRLYLFNAGLRRIREAPLR